MKELGRLCQMMMLAAACLLSGCAGGADLPLLPRAEAGQYRLDAGDEVRISAYGLDALTNSYLVSDTGFVSLPLIGNIPAKGKTVGELQDQITKILLDQQILRSPSVNVQVTKYRPFYIMRSEEHTSELQSLMRISYAVFCLKKKKKSNRKYSKQ